MDAYYSKEEQQRFGVVGIELSPEHYVLEPAGKQTISDAAALAARLWEHPAGELAGEFAERNSRHLRWSNTVFGCTAPSRTHLVVSRGLHMTLHLGHFTS